MSRHDYVSPDQLISWTQRFIRFPSEQSDLLERAPAVQSFIADCVAPLIGQHGLTARRDAMGNLIVMAGPVDAEHSIALFAYAMTHPAARMQRPFDGDLGESPDGAYIRGRGVSEQKAAMAASLAAFLDLADAGAVRRQFSWVLLSAGETGRHDAIAAALDAFASRPKFGVLAIGTGGRVALGHRGRLDIEVLIEGRASHSSTPWRGVDVVPGVREILVRASTIGAGLGHDSRVGPASLVCTSIRTAPNATHTLQSEARMTFDRRLMPSESPDVAFHSVASAFALDPPLTVKVDRGAFMYGYCLEPSSALVSMIAQSSAAAGLAAPPVFHSSSALDAGYLLMNDIEALAWGPGDEQYFHADEERIQITDIVSAARRYRALLQLAAAG